MCFLSLFIPNCNIGIATRFGTCHDSRAVMACAKVCTDQRSRLCRPISKIRLILLMDAKTWMTSLIIMFALCPICVQDYIFKMSSESPGDLLKGRNCIMVKWYFVILEFSMGNHKGKVTLVKICIGCLIQGNPIKFTACKTTTNILNYEDHIHSAKTILIAQSKIAVTPLLTHWSYCSHALGMLTEPSTVTKHLGIYIYMMFIMIFLWLLITFNTFSDFTTQFKVLRPMRSNCIS